MEFDDLQLPTRIVGFGGKPAEVTVEEVEALQRLTQSDILREPWKYLPEGTIAIIESGPLAGVRGVICVDETRRRLIISVTLLQRSVAIQLDEGTSLSVIAFVNSFRRQTPGRIFMLKE